MGFDVTTLGGIPDISQTVSAGTGAFNRVGGITSQFAKNPTDPRNIYNTAQGVMSLWKKFGSKTKVKPSMSLGNLPKQKLQRSYLFDFIVPYVFGGVSGQEIVTLVQSIDVAQNDLTVDTVYYGARPRGIAGKVTPATLTVTYLCMVPDIVSKFYQAWRDEIVTKDGYYGVKFDYLRTVSVVMYDTDGSTSGTYEMSVFPLTLPKFSMSYSNNNVQQVSITFHVDSVDMVTGDGGIIGKVLHAFKF